MNTKKGVLEYVGIRVGTYRSTPSLPTAAKDARAFYRLQDALFQRRVKRAEQNAKPKRKIVLFAIAVDADVKKIAAPAKVMNPRDGDTHPNSLVLNKMGYYNFATAFQNLKRKTEQSSFGNG